MLKPLTSLFDYEAVKLEKTLLKEHSLKLFTQYKETYNQQCFNRLTEVTKTQSLSKIWNIHWAERITASNFHSAIHTKNSVSTLNKLMQYQWRIQRLIWAHCKREARAWENQLGVCKPLSGYRTEPCWWMGGETPGKF